MEVTLHSVRPLCVQNLLALDAKLNKGIQDGCNWFGYALKIYGKMTMPCQEITEGGCWRGILKVLVVWERLPREVDAKRMALIYDLLFVYSRLVRTRPWTLNRQRKNQDIGIGH